MQAFKCLPSPCSGNNHLVPIDILTDLTQTNAPNGHPNLNELQHNQRGILSSGSLAMKISTKVFTIHQTSASNI